MLLIVTAQYWVSCSVPRVAFAVVPPLLEVGRMCQHAELELRDLRALPGVGSRRQHVPAPPWASRAHLGVGVFVHTCGCVHTCMGVGVRSCGCSGARCAPPTALQYDP